MIAPDNSISNKPDSKLKSGTKNEDSMKKGLRFLDLIKIPNGRANIRTPKNRKEL